jgi:uncharacterized protein (TIGR03437 family)
MNTAHLRLLPFLLLASTALAQPVISSGGIVNAASSLPPGLPGGALAQGSLFVIYGSGLGPGALESSRFPLFSTLAGTSVNVSVGGVTKSALLVYTSSTQVAALLPSSTPTGTGTLSVTYNGQTSGTAAIRVRSSSFGLFTLNQGGFGPVVAQNFVSPASLPVNTLIEPAHAGQTIILYGTGLGPVSFDETGPANALPLNVPLAVSVGGKAATVTYAGRSACCAGLDQINIIVPEGVESCYAPVYVRAGSVTSNFASLSIAAPGTTACSDASGMSAQDLTKLKSNASSQIGAFYLNRLLVNSSYTESIVAFIYKATPLQLSMTRSLHDSLTPGSCTVIVGRANAGAGLGILDAGPRLTVVGPKASGAAIRASNGGYSALLGGGPVLSILTDGQYTVDNGSGGADIGAFKASTQAVSTATWTNMSSITSVNRAEGVQVTWSGGDPNGFVRIQGSVGGSEVADLPGEFQVFTCLERTSAGKFTVPPAVLQALPPIGGGGGALYVGTQAISPRFTATGMDFGYTRTLLWTGTAMSFQ